MVNVGFGSDHLWPWMLFLREEPKPRVEVNGVTTHLQPDGITYTTATDWFDPANESHAAVASQLELALLRSGVLHRNPMGAVSRRLR